jgi:hypothetical protein
MARTYGTTTARGYGTPHQKLRKQLIAAFTPGQPCARCGQPIWNPAEADLGHTDDKMAYTGLEHQRCNRADGPRRGNKLRRRPVIAWITSRRW